MQVGIRLDTKDGDSLLYADTFDTQAEALAVVEKILETDVEWIEVLGNTWVRMDRVVKVSLDP